MPMSWETQYYVQYANYSQRNYKLISSIFHFFPPATPQRAVEVAATLPRFSLFR